MYGDKISDHSNVSFTALPLIDEAASFARPLHDDYPPWASVDEVLSREGSNATLIAGITGEEFNSIAWQAYQSAVANLGSHFSF